MRSPATDETLTYSDTLAPYPTITCLRQLALRVPNRKGRTNYWLGTGNKQTEKNRTRRYHLPARLKLEGSDFQAAYSLGHWSWMSSTSSPCLRRWCEVGPRWSPYGVGMSQASPAPPIHSILVFRTHSSPCQHHCN